MKHDLLCGSQIGALVFMAKDEAVLRVCVQVELTLEDGAASLLILGLCSLSHFKVLHVFVAILIRV